ncbi:MAG: hypothetical protein WD969_09925 [Paracoccaceae bacterium]
MALIAGSIREFGFNNPVLVDGAMGRYMAELGLTPSARSRVPALPEEDAQEPIDRIEFVIVKPMADGAGSGERLPMNGGKTEETRRAPAMRRIHVDHDL